MKRYMVYKEFHKMKGKTYPVGTEFINTDGKRIVCDNRLMCYRDSAKANECLVGNDDGRGMERGKLLDTIEGLLIGLNNEKLLYERVMALWNDEVAMKYARCSDPDSEPWLFNADVRCADISDLSHIIALLKEQKG